MARICNLETRKGMNCLLQNDYTLGDGLSQEWGTQLVLHLRKWQVIFPTKLWWPVGGGWQTSRSEVRLEKGKKRFYLVLGWAAGLYQIHPIYLASSADKQPCLLSPAEEFLIWTVGHPHPSCNPSPVQSRDFSWNESLPRHFSCQIGNRIVESCKLQPS